MDRVHRVGWGRAQGGNGMTWLCLPPALPSGAWVKSLASLSLIFLVYEVEQKSRQSTESIKLSDLTAWIPVLTSLGCVALGKPLNLIAK